MSERQTTLLDDWAIAHGIDLFDLVDRPKPKGEKARGAYKAHAWLILRLGETKGKTCGECGNLLRADTESGHSFPKCKLYRVSNSANSDWRLKWTACGAFK